MIKNFLNWLTEEKEKRYNTAGVAIIYNDKLLMVKSSNSSNWSLPKGILEPNEDILEGALRELSEETGIKLSKKQILKYNNQPQKHNYTNFKNKNKTLFYYIYFINNLSEINLESENIPKNQLQLKEIDQCKFLSKKEAIELYPYDKTLIINIFKFKEKYEKKFSN